MNLGTLIYTRLKGELVSQGIRADTAMLDFEDALMPSWGNLMAGQRNVRAAAAAARL